MLPPMTPTLRVGFEDIVESSKELWTVQTAGAGPAGSLPLTAEMLLESSSGDLFGLTQNAGMGWDPRELTRPQFLMLSTQGGVRAPDGHPIALGYHTGHWEVGLLMQAAAAELKRLECLPFAAFVSDPCDGRTQGTTGMMDSLPYRNDAAIVFRRLIRSLPTRQGVLGIATCDKGLPAMMMALAAMRDLPCVLVPGGVTLPPKDGEDAGRVQSIGARFAQGEVSLERAAELGCRACGTPGGGCQFLGTAATSQVVGEALGLSLPHTALAPSGQPVWLDMATRSARAMAACGTPWSFTRPSAARPICFSTSPPSRMPRGCTGPRWKSGSRSTAACLAWSTRCPMDRRTIRRCVYSWPAASPRSCSTCDALVCSIWRCSPSRATSSVACSTGGKLPTGAARSARSCVPTTASIPTR